MSSQNSIPTWNCQIILTGPALTQEARNQLSLKWLEIILESGGTLSPRHGGASVAAWPADQKKSPLASAWKLREAATRINQELQASGKPELRLTLLLHGPELCEVVEAPLLARRRHAADDKAPVLLLTEEAASKIGEGFILRRAETHGLLTLYQTLGPRRAPAGRIEVSIDPIHSPLAAPQPRPSARPAPAPIVILGSYEMRPAPGTSERNREFELVRAG